MLVPNLLTSCQRLVENLLQCSWIQQADLLQVVPITCYHGALQVHFNNLLRSCFNNDNLESIRFKYGTSSATDLDVGLNCTVLKYKYTISVIRTP